MSDAGRIKGRAGTPLPAEARTESAPYHLTKAAFENAVAKAKSDLRGLVPKLSDWLKEIFSLRLALQTSKQTYPGLAADLDALLPADFLRRTPFERVPHLPRYLKGMQARAERARRDPAKDAARVQELAPFVAAVKKLGDEAGELRWALEEFRVSLFAQELGTAEPISAVRLQRMIEEMGRANPPGEPKAAGAAGRDQPSQGLRPTGDSPYLKPTTATKKSTPLKSLGSLDQLFRK